MNIKQFINACLAGGLFLETALNGQDQTPPGITKQPANQLVSRGANATFSVNTLGTTPLDYRWFFNDAPMDGATNRSLAITNAQLANVGRYAVVITNLYGSITSQVATLTVDPTFTKLATHPTFNRFDESFGCNWVDYDNDGFIELFVVNGGWYGSLYYTNALYRYNSADGTFSKLTTNEVGSLVGEKADWWFAAWGDYDNDGLIDVKLSKGGPGVLYRQQANGKFIKVTRAGALPVPQTFSCVPAWGDYNQDGFLDLFMANEWHDSTTTPYNWTNILYCNRGNGVFTVVNSRPLVQNNGWNVEGTGWGDMDGDGDLDLVLGTWTGPKVFRNDGNDQFVLLTGGALGKETDVEISPSWGDYDNDGWLDVFLTSGGLFHNDGNGEWTKTQLGGGVLGIWGDYDNDGWLDLFICRGGGGNATTNLLYHNNGDGRFSLVTAGSVSTDSGLSLTCAWGDYDNDGFLDLFVTTRAGYDKLLYHNNGNSNHWIMIKLVGTASNRSAIGAKVRVKATIGGKTVWQTREIAGGNRAQNDIRAHFGLGDATSVDLVRIEWPSGNVQESSGPRAMCRKSAMLFPTVLSPTPRWCALRRRIPLPARAARSL